MPIEERREELLAAARAVMLEQGRAVTTKQIAQRAGVSEGTVFNVFSSKDELVDATIRSAMFPPGYLADLAAVPAGAGLRETLYAIARIDQAYLLDRLSFMEAAHVFPHGQTHDGEHRSYNQERRRIVRDLVEPFGAELAVDIATALTAFEVGVFGASHPGFTGEEVPAPERIVDLVLDGIAVRRGRPPLHDASAPLKDQP